MGAKTDLHSETDDLGIDRNRGQQIDFLDRTTISEHDNIGGEDASELQHNSDSWTGRSNHPQRYREPPRWMQTGDYMI